MRLFRLMKKKQRGFTLVELLVAMAVVAIVLTMGLPELASYLRNSRLTTQTNHFIAVMNFARAQSISRNQEVFITSLADNNANHWEQGWQIWIDGSAACPDTVPNETMEDCEVLRDFKLESSVLKGPSNLASVAYPRLKDATMKARTFSFNGGNGSLNISQEINFYLCDPKGKYEGRHISMRPTGRLRLVDAHLSPCPPA